MKTKKKKAFNLNKLQIAKFNYVDSVKGGGTKTPRTRTQIEVCGGDTGECIESSGC